MQTLHEAAGQMFDAGTYQHCLEDARGFDEPLTAEDLARARALLFTVSGSALLNGDKCPKEDAHTLYRIVCYANSLLIGKVPSSDAAVQDVAQAKGTGS